MNKDNTNKSCNCKEQSSNQKTEIFASMFLKLSASAQDEMLKVMRMLATSNEKININH